MPFLQSMLDQRLALFLERGMKYGFRIGVDSTKQIQSAPSNMVSVSQRPTIVDEYIAEEVANGRLVPETATQINPIGIILKKNRPNKFRMIINLSAPIGQSVNDAIEPSLCSLQYASVADAARRLQDYGAGALMAKLDLKAAYRMVIVHPADSPLLGIRWRESTLIDRALPFGLRSAPIIFSAVADALACAMHCEGVQYRIHYLDDFFCGPANSTSCAKDVNIAIPLCNRLGLPVAPEKVEGPVIAITFLGIEINSATMTLSLPQDKLTALKARLASWVGKRRASKRQLQELLGHLNHAAAVVRPGKSFPRYIIEAMKFPRLPSQFTHIDTQCRADILWWSIFVSSWNGVSLLPPATPNVTIISDASGSWGCGPLTSAQGSGSKSAGQLPGKTST